MGLEVKPLPHLPTRVNIPLSSGRIVEFRHDRLTACIRVREFHDQLFEIVGECDFELKPINYLPKTGRSKSGGECGSCREDANILACDFDNYKCIRCGKRIPNTTPEGLLDSLNCKRNGIGDRILWLTKKLGIKHCVNCSIRRGQMNRLDRWLYRKGWNAMRLFRPQVHPVRKRDAV